jgi:hypothetical protein
LILEYANPSQLLLSPPSYSPSPGIRGLSTWDLNWHKIDIDQDLHDGAGLSDATTPNGNVSNAIFENVDYDLLAIGNHELYVTEIAYETFSNFSKVYGDRYLTSNVQIINPETGKYEYIGAKYRYFTTEQGT